MIFFSCSSSSPSPFSFYSYSTGRNLSKLCDFCLFFPTICFFGGGGVGVIVGRGGGGGGGDSDVGGNSVFGIRTAVGVGVIVGRGGGGVTVGRGGSGRGVKVVVIMVEMVFLVSENLAAKLVMTAMLMTV